MSTADVEADGACAPCLDKTRTWIKNADRATSAKDLRTLKALLTSCPLSGDDESAYRSRFSELVLEARRELQQRKEQLQAEREEAALQNRERIEAMAKDIVEKNSATIEITFSQKSALSPFHPRWLTANEYTVEAKHIEACRNWLKLPSELVVCKDALIKRVNELLRQKQMQSSTRAKRLREAAVGCADVSTFFLKEQRIQ